MNKRDDDVKWGWITNGDDRDLHEREEEERALMNTYTTHHHHVQLLHFGPYNYNNYATTSPNWLILILMALPLFLFILFFFLSLSFIQSNSKQHLERKEK